MNKNKKTIREQINAIKLKVSKDLYEMLEERFAVKTKASEIP